MNGDMNHQTVVVTGGAGFIGSHLVDLQLESGANVCVIDNLSYGRRSFLPPEGPNFHFFNGDILDENPLEEVLTRFKPNTLYHLAAIHHIPTCERKPDLALRVNVEGTQRLLSRLRETESLQRIVFASSGAVYDTLDGPLSEETRVVPHDIYAVSKATGEHLMRLHAKRTGATCIVARLFNALGARETNAHIVPDMLEQVLAGRRTIELGNLEPKRSYIHVADAAAGLSALGSFPIAEGFQVFNVGSEENYSVAELVALLSEALGEELVSSQVPERTRRVDRPTQQADIGKIRSVAQWGPMRTVRMALAEALKEAFAGREERVVGEMGCSGRPLRAG